MYSPRFRTYLVLAMTCLCVAQVSIAQEKVRCPDFKGDKTELADTTSNEKASLELKETVATTLQEAKSFGNSETSLAWFSTSTFLSVTKSDFPVLMKSSINENQLSIDISSTKGGNILVFGVGKKSDEIFPLCGDYEYVSHNTQHTIECNEPVFASLKEHKLVFAFVIDSKADIDSIRRFVQLRANLSSGSSLKGLNLNGYAEDGYADTSKPVQNNIAQSNPEEPCSENCSADQASSNDEANIGIAVNSFESRLNNVI